VDGLFCITYLLIFNFVMSVVLVLLLLVVLVLVVWGNGGDCITRS